MISGKARLLSHNSGHTAILRSAKISLQETSYVRKTLGIKGGIHGDSNNPVAPLAGLSLGFYLGH